MSAAYSLAAEYDKLSAECDRLRIALAQARRERDDAELHGRQWRFAAEEARAALEQLREETGR